MKESLKKFLSVFRDNEEGNNKKKIQNLIFFLILLIITIISINLIWNDDNKSTDSNSSQYKELATQKNITEYETTNNTDDLEEKLKIILSKMNGVGNTEILITYSESSEDVFLYNETTKTTITKETDSEGGNRDTNQTDTTKEVVYKDENGESIPITQKIISPKLEGALILAQGASDANIKSNIIQAVEALTGLPTHKIQVFEM